MMNWSFEDIIRAAEDEELYDKLLEDLGEARETAQRFAKEQGWTEEHMMSFTSQVVWQRKKYLLGIEDGIVIVPRGLFPS